MKLELQQAFGACQTVRLPTRGRRRYGVAPGGAFDQESFELACALVQSDSEEALELAFGTFRFLVMEAAIVAAVGAVGALLVDGSELLRSSGAVAVEPGNLLEVRIGSFGARVYVTTGAPHSSVSRTLADPPKSLQSRTLRVIAQDVRILESVYEVSPISDRVGVRLHGFPHQHTVERPSEPTVAGAVQATPDGTLILIGPDGPTIGGYPVYGFICTADLDKIGQLRPGALVQFDPIDLETARELQLEKMKRLRRSITDIRLSLQF